jgi:predicted MPP superfamily phosphohydrolase
MDNENLRMTSGPWLQNMTPTGVTVCWTTNRPAVPSVNLVLPDGSKSFVRNSHDGSIDAGGTLHKIRIEGLQPGTAYKYSPYTVQIMKYQAYKVYYGDTLSGKYISFTTPRQKSDKVSFVVINDVHELSGKLASYLRNINIPSQDFFIFNGDMVNFLQETNQLYPAIIDTAVHYFASEKPFFYVRGNHETRGYMTRELKEWFDYKDNRFYYSFDRGPVHFTILDCGEDKPDNSKEYYGLADFDAYRLEELKWLKNEVKSDAFRNAPKRIVIIHMPVLKEEQKNPGKQHHGMKFLADNFGPVLQNSGIDLMISAHTHQNSYYDREKSGFGYHLLVNSHLSFVEVTADNQKINAVVKDMNGKVIAEYDLK